MSLSGRGDSVSRVMFTLPGGDEDVDVSLTEISGVGAPDETF